MSLTLLQSADPPLRLLRFWSCKYCSIQPELVRSVKLSSCWKCWRMRELTPSMDDSNMPSSSNCWKFVNDPSNSALVNISFKLQGPQLFVTNCLIVALLNHSCFKLEKSFVLFTYSNLDSYSDLRRIKAKTDLPLTLIFQFSNPKIPLSVIQKERNSTMVWFCKSVLLWSWIPHVEDKSVQRSSYLSEPLETSWEDKYLISCPCSWSVRRPVNVS